MTTTANSAKSRFAHAFPSAPQSAPAPTRRERIWVRMPNWLGDVVMAAPLVRALRAAQPDSEVTLIVKAAFAPLLAECSLAEKIITLPPRRGWSYWRFFRELRNKCPDKQVMFTNSLRGDLEARLVGAPRRLGVKRTGKWRPLLTRAWHVPENIAEVETHQTHFWTHWWRNAGLLPNATPEATLDLTPFHFHGKKPDATSAATPVVGLICGSANNPAKRWPAKCWRALIELLLERHSVRFRLLGTADDAIVTREIARNMPPDAVEDLAGKTDLLQLAQTLAECRCVVGNDTGGIHLANMLGVPVVGVFGPTNPARTAPVFAAPTIILQPDSRGPSKPADTASIEAVSSERVAEACATFLIQ